MREILFKAKSIDKYEKGKWVEGYLFDDGYENGRIFVGNLEIQEYKGAACDNWDIVGTCFYEVDPSTVCRYTGLTDKNDEKIWENDIVEVPTLDGYFLIQWSDMQACWEMDNEIDSIVCDFDNYWSYDVEVVGNAFDNPSLIGRE